MWGYLEYCGDIMSTMGVILRTVEDTQYHGGKTFLFKYPHGTEHPHGTHIPHVHHDILPWTDYPHGTEHTLYKVIFRPLQGISQRNFKDLGLNCTIFPIKPMNVLSNNTLLEDAQEGAYVNFYSLNTDLLYYGKNVKPKFTSTKFW